MHETARKDSGPLAPLARGCLALAAQAGVKGLISHPAVGGNAHVDAVDIVAEAEAAGIRAVLVLQEMAGPSGRDFGLVHVQPEADALVSTGNRVCPTFVPSCGSWQMAQVIGRWSADSFST